MRWRDHVLVNQETLVNSGTKNIDINITDPITQLFIQVGAKNGATYNKENLILHNITKIELVDGGDVILSARGEVLRGLYSHTMGQIPGEYYTEVADDYPIEYLIIPFGRWLFDEQYALNPTAHHNLALKLTWDLGHVRAIGADSFLTGSLNLTVIATVMEDVPAPVAVLTAREIYDFSTAAAGDEKVNMPVLHPWRTLMFRAREADVDMKNTITYAKLSVDAGKFEHFYLTTGRLLSIMTQVYGPLAINRLCVADNGEYKDTFMGLSFGGLITSKEHDYQWSAADWYMSRVLLYGTLHDGTHADDKAVYVYDRGVGFENCCVIPMGRPEEPASWFIPPSTGKVDFYLTQGDAGGECQVVVQEARTY